MTTFQALTVLMAYIGGVISLIGVILSAIALSRTRRLTEQQLRLHKKQEELTDLQLQMLRSEAAAKAANQSKKPSMLPMSNSATADVRVQLRGTSRDTKFLIQNWGQGPARNVNVTALSKVGGMSPFLHGDYDQKLPIPELLPGDVVSLLAAITLGMGPTFNVVTTWQDPDGSERKREHQVSLM